MTTQQLIQSLFISDTNSLGILDIFLAITIPFALSLFVALFYKKTTHNNHYSINFIYTLPLFASLTSIITLLIGSNIARAFGLVGALSLIRFRTAVKEPLDSIFLFWSLAIGMACGTGFYMAAAMIVVLGITYMSIIYKFKFAASNKIHVILKASFNQSPKGDEIKSFEKKCHSFFSHMTALNMYTNTQSGEDQFVYSCQLKQSVGASALAKDVQSISGVKNVEIVNQDSALYI
ncbi:MAG: DUF4956 domain-containing protein [Bdellovibrionaceae bacterium]|jgi:hypothetical protein|nr:DUF4956 domain-containing protein [Pseudobdellovibrionaceae bacterium]